MYFGKLFALYEGNTYIAKEKFNNKSEGNLFKFISYLHKADHHGSCKSNRHTDSTSHCISEPSWLYVGSIHTLHIYTHHDQNRLLLY